MKLKLITALTATALLFAGQANADTVTGKISRFFVSSLNNMAFRITLDVPIPGECNTLLYVDGASSNYQVYVSALMLAYSQGKDLDITYVVQPSGFCMIAEFQVR